MKLLHARHTKWEELHMVPWPSKPGTSKAGKPEAHGAAQRHGYRADRSNRLIGMAGTMAIYAVALAAVFFSVSHVMPVKSPSALTVVDTSPEASPKETPPKDKEAPKPVEKRERQSEPPKVQPLEPTIIPLAPISLPFAVATPKPPEPSPEAEPVAPRTLPAPPAPQVASNGPDTWEGRVLAALNKHRQYPRAAIIRRHQGVPYIRFVMDRQGKVLSVKLERASGIRSLDNEALALPKRAQPLPRPPETVKGDAIELVVPIEFFVT